MVSDSCTAILKIFSLGFKQLRTRLTVGGSEYLAMVLLPVKCMSLHTDVNNSREMTTKPHAGVEGN
jgi:hypothetical protein